MADSLTWDAIGERIRQVRLSLPLTQGDLARAVGLDRTMIVKVESGARRLDALELVRISSALQVSMDYLIRPQPEVISRRSAPLTEDTATDITRQSHRLEIALVEWLREVRQLVGYGLLQTRSRLTYPGSVSSDADARRTANWVRDQLGLGADPLGSLASICEQAGQFVLATELPGDGASVIDGDLAVAVVSRVPDPGRRRATVAHELGHMVIGDEYSSDLGVHASRGDREAVIDAFAAELLLPTQALSSGLAGSSVLTRELLVEFAARYRTSWSLALRQAELAGRLTREVRQKWSQQKPTRAEFMEAVGWAPQPDLEAERVPPSYAQAVLEALRQDLVTTSRAVELLHDQLNESDLPTMDEVEIEP